MDADGYRHDGEYTEVEDGVDEDSEGAGAHVAELHHPDPRRQLEQEPRRQQDEQHHRHDDRPSVRRRHLPVSRAHLRCDYALLCLLATYTESNRVVRSASVWGVNKGPVNAIFGSKQPKGAKGSGGKRQRRAESSFITREERRRGLEFEVG
ncbi:unnamed protein product [Miscanthus lutarioriparius]|uniref:Uncharacterized protein n=1 Tax=Miscanthus lutarioriparius TaxID=422564 RepID=A0A811NPJ0_9POAL|nr:unnamed protein product [Miscanthus lutarioriparius]